MLASKYAKFSKAADLPTRIERLRVEGFKSVKIPQKSLTNAVKGGIIDTERSVAMYRKRRENKIEPMPKKQLQKIEKAFKKRGGIIERSKDIDSYLDSKNAEAITYNQQIILLKSNPGRASVFEELIHATQYKKGQNDGSYESRLRCEIEAQQKLIKHSKAYKLTKAEIEQTKASLETYKKEYEKYKKGGS